MLLDKGNKFPSFSPVRAVRMTETLREPSGFGAKIVGYEHRWHIGTGLELRAMLTLLQDG